MTVEILGHPGPFSVVLADPPWTYQAWAGEREEGRTAESHYPAQTPAEIIETGNEVMQGRVSRNAALFLWATPPAIRDAFEVMEGWGFGYRTFAFVWEKETDAGVPATGMGHYTRANAEVVLLGIRGRMSVSPSARPNQIVRARRGVHSAKPVEVHRRIERMYPCARRLELYARRREPGWSAWGNELEAAAPETLADQIALGARRGLAARLEELLRSGT